MDKPGSTYGLIDIQYVDLSLYVTILNCMVQAQKTHLAMESVLSLKGFSSFLSNF